MAVVEIAPVACSEVDLGAEVAMRWEGQVSGIAPPIGPVSCIPDQGNAPAEKSWLYRAPVAGRYAFTLSERYGATDALAVFSEGCLEELACVGRGLPAPIHLELDLEENQLVTLVGSARGSGDTDYTLTLTVELLPTP